MSAVADPRRGGGGPGGSATPLFLDQTEARRAEKILFLETGPPPLSKGLDDQTPPPPHPPYLKVWIRH